MHVMRTCSPQAVSVPKLSLHNALGSTLTSCAAMAADFYMHPAVGDSALHLSLVPENASTDPISPMIPISLAVLALPSRRNGLLRAPWAAAVSGPMQASRDVTGDMAVTETAQVAGVGHCQLLFCGLQSRSAALGTVNGPQSVTVSQVWALLSVFLSSYCWLSQFDK